MLFPNGFEPCAATYNRSLLRALAGLGCVVRVIAPIMWCPVVESQVRNRRLPPREEVLDGIPVAHPRVFYTPGMAIDRHYLLYRWQVRRTLAGAVRDRRAAASGDGGADSSTTSESAGRNPMLRRGEGPHVMLGFIYPDAVALAPVCRALGVDYSIRVNGSDFRVRVRQEKFRDRVLGELHEAPLVFCPGQALKSDMVAAGVDGDKIVSFNNGVDQGVFNRMVF